VVWRRAHRLSRARIRRAPHDAAAGTDDGVHLAYMVLGQGPVDLVLVPGFVSHLEWWFDHPSARRWTERLASFTRLILFDKRGTGLSDRTERIGDLDRRMLDVRAVMDAAGSEQAVILGASEGGAMAVLLAASAPERTSGLVLYGTWPRFSWAPDYPYGVTSEQLEAVAEFLEREWGSGAGLGAWAPSVRDDPSARRWWGRATARRQPGGGVEAALANAEADVRGVLDVSTCRHWCCTPLAIASCLLRPADSSPSTSRAPGSLRSRAVIISRSSTVRTRSSTRSKSWTGRQGTR